MKTIKINIPTMKSAHCQTTVSAAVTSAGGTVETTSPGLIQVSLTDAIPEDRIIMAIESAGYKVDLVQSDDVLKFQTNINCAGCVAKATPFLDAAVGSTNWSVNTSVANKELVVKAKSEEKVLEALKQAGFKAQRI